VVSICEIRNCFLIQQTVSSVSHCYHLHGMTIAIASGCGTTHCLSQLLNLPHNHLYLPHTPRDRPMTETSQQTEAAGRSVNHSHVCRHQCRIVPRQLTPDWLPPTDRGKVVMSPSVTGHRPAFPRSVGGSRVPLPGDRPTGVSHSRPRRLRSSDSLTCVVRRAHNTYGDRCFATAGPRVWNSLPIELQHCDSLGRFKWCRETFLFRSWNYGALWLFVK